MSSLLLNNRADHLTERLDSSFSFSLAIINLISYLFVYLLNTRREMSTYTEEGANSEKNEPLAEAPSPQILYDLFGITNHTGTLNQGHYIANVKVDNRWYQCNDSFISCLGESIEESDVMNSAYMLFYLRRDVVSDV